MGGCTLLLVRSAETTTTTITMMEEVKDTVTPLLSVRSRPPDGDPEDEAAGRMTTSYQGERKDVADPEVVLERADEKSRPEGEEEKEFEKAAHMRVMPTDYSVTATSEPVQSWPRNVEGDEETFSEPVLVVETKSETDHSGELRQDLQSEQERNNNLTSLLLTTSSNNVTKLTIEVPLLSAEEPLTTSSAKEPPPRQQLKREQRSSVATGSTRTLSTSTSTSNSSSSSSRPSSNHSSPTLVTEDATAAGQPRSKQIELPGLTCTSGAAAEKQLSSPPFKRPAERSPTPPAGPFCWTNPTEAAAESRLYKRPGELMTRNRPAAAAAEGIPNNFSFQTVAPGPNCPPVPLEIADLGDNTADVAGGMSRLTRDVSPEPGVVVSMKEQLDRLERQGVEMRMRSRAPRSSSIIGPRVVLPPANATVLSCCSSDPVDVSSWMQTCETRNHHLGRGSGVAQFRERYNFDVERGVPARESGEERWEWQRQHQQQ